jgi:SNF2 family DNA or RNA helicase
MSFIDIKEQEIRAIAYNIRTYDLGVAYFLNKKVSNFTFTPDKGMIKADVTGTWSYTVEIKIRENGSVYSYHCTCPAYEEYPGACKHIVAVLKTAQRKLSNPPPVPSGKKAASEIMALFTNYQHENLHEELNLHLQLQLNPQHRLLTHLHLKVGLTRLYVVKDLEEFLTSIRTGCRQRFGMEFNYDPLRHTFKEQDRQIITMLQEMQEQHLAVNEISDSYFSFSPLSRKPFPLSKYHLGKLLDALGDKVFFLALESGNLHSTQVLRQGLPLEFSLKNKERALALALEDTLPIQLTTDGRYYLYKQEIYLASPEQKEFLPPLLRALKGKIRPDVVFPADQRDIFASEVLPFIEKLGSVSIEPRLAKRFIKEDLHPKIYFDRAGENYITARLEFHYGSKIINPFSSNLTVQDTQTSNEDILIRDIDRERKILSVLEQADFIVSQGTISLANEDKIFEFTVHWLPELQKLAEIFYSENFKLKIRSTTSFSGQIRLNESLDMLEISFQYSDLDPAELANIFNSLKLKKKYYRLRDGTFLDLNQPEMESIADLLGNLNLRTEELNNQVFHLPKYRAMYIDSFLRQANLPGIQRNRAFKQLVQSILEPQDGEFEIPAKLHNVLRDYQKTGFKWLKTLASFGLGGILADDMGLGKTLQVLAFILSEKTSSAPALVIAPTSLVYNWKMEGEKFTPDLNALVIEGTPEERREQLDIIDRFDLVVTSYPILRRDIESFTRHSFSYCFLDEAQNIKNPQTLNAKSVQQLKAKGYFALTGTPIENSLTELWSLFNFFMPGYLLSYREFHKKYAMPIQKGDNPQALRELNRHIKPFILRRLKKDVLKELPPKIETQINAPLTEEQRKIYLAYLQQTKSQIAQELSTSGFAKSHLKILAALTRLRQICCHPAMFIDNYTGESGKMLLFQEILAEALESDHRILVFSQFTSMLEIIQNYLNTKNIEHFYLNGSTKSLERSQMAQSFNAGEGKIFLISLKAGGTGLNLTGADTVIHFDPWWNPAVEDQATDRAHRIGQNNSVQVIRLLTQGTIEEKVNILQAKKKKLIDSVIQPGQTMLSKLTEQELKEIFEMD